MKFLLQVDFPYKGPWADEMAEAMKELAHSIAQEQGLIWKIWTVNENTNEAGGIYLFEDAENANRYLAMHTARLQGFGIPYVNGKLFEVNQVLSLIDRGPIL
jgi:hypothetical protein